MKQNASLAKAVHFIALLSKLCDGKVFGSNAHFRHGNGKPAGALFNRRFELFGRLYGGKS